MLPICVKFIVKIRVVIKNLYNLKYDHRVKNKKYPTPLPYLWDAGW